MTPSYRLATSFFFLIIIIIYSLTLKKQSFRTVSTCEYCESPNRGKFRAVYSEGVISFD